MGAICYLEKTGLPLHQGSNQNDGRRVQTFSKVLKKEEVGQIKILEVQEGSFYKRKFKCALKRTACLYKNQHSTGFQRSKRRAQNSKRPFKNRRGKLRNRRSILLFQTRRHPSHANSALRKSRAICRSADPRYRRGVSLFQPRQHLSHAHSAWRKLRTICRRFLIKKKAREAILINHALVADTSERIVPLQVLKNFL